MEATQAGAAPVAGRVVVGGGVHDGHVEVQRHGARHPRDADGHLVTRGGRRRSTSQRLADGYGSGRTGRRPTATSGALPVGVLGMGNERDREDTVEDWGIGRVRVDKGYYCLLVLL